MTLGAGTCLQAELIDICGLPGEPYGADLVVRPDANAPQDMECMSSCTKDARWDGVGDCLTH